MAAEPEQSTEDPEEGPPQLLADSFVSTCGYIHPVAPVAIGSTSGSLDARTAVGTYPEVAAPLASRHGRPQPRSDPTRGSRLPAWVFCHQSAETLCEGRLGGSVDTTNPFEETTLLPYPMRRTLDFFGPLTTADPADHR